MTGHKISPKKLKMIVVVTQIEIKTIFLGILKNIKIDS